MDTNNMNVPYIVYEGAQARQERTIKRLVIIIIIAVSMLFASNAVWLYAWMQYDYETEVQQVDFDSGEGGVNNFIGRDLSGGLYNGEDESEDYEGETDTQER